MPAGWTEREFHGTDLDDEPPIAGGREIWGFPKK